MERLEQEKKRLCDIMRASGKYLPTYEPLIAQAVQMESLLYACYEAIMSQGVSMIEVGREGERRKMHPLLTRYSELSKEYRCILAEMGLTYSSQPTMPTRGDELSDLIGDVEKIETR